MRTTQSPVLTDTDDGEPIVPEPPNLWEAMARFLEEHPQEAAQREAQERLENKLSLRN